MNRKIAMIGAYIESAAVALFAAFLLLDFPFGSYFVCMFLPIGYILTVAGFFAECDPERRTAACAGLVFAAVYAVLIFLVYFAQTTAVRLSSLNDQALTVLDFQRGGLLFDYDLLGYGMMALSTFFAGLSLRPESSPDRWLKRLLMIHGAFFPGCFLLPMTGMFQSMASGEAGNGGTVALLCWCVYFLPVCVLTLRHFRSEKR